MFDEIKNNRGIYKHYSRLNQIFELPIAEIMGKDKQGFLYFSKIKIDGIYFDINRNETSYILEPIEIRYFNLLEEKDVKIWKGRKRIDNKYRYKKAIINWILKENIQPNEIIDYGQFNTITKELEFIKFVEEVNTYIEEEEKRREMMHDFKRKADILSNLYKVRKMLRKNKNMKKKFRKTICKILNKDISNKNKFTNLN